MIQEIGHKGGVVRQILAHPQPDGLTAELTVALCGLHMNAHGRCAQEEQYVDRNQERGKANGRTAFCPSSSSCHHLDVRHLSTMLSVCFVVTQTSTHQRLLAPLLVSAVKVKARPPPGSYLCAIIQTGLNPLALAVFAVLHSLKSTGLQCSSL